MLLFRGRASEFRRPILVFHPSPPRQLVMIPRGHRGGGARCLAVGVTGGGGQAQNMARPAARRKKNITPAARSRAAAPSVMAPALDLFWSRVPSGFVGESGSPEKELSALVKAGLGRCLLEGGLQEQLHQQFARCHRCSCSSWRTTR